MANTKDILMFTSKIIALSQDIYLNSKQNIPRTSKNDPENTCMVIMLTKPQSNGNGDDRLARNCDTHILQIACYEL
jgi:hypothetical protein